MLCKGWSVVSPQLFRAQLHIAHPLVGAGTRFKPPSPGRSPLLPLPLCQVQGSAWLWVESAHSGAEAVWLDWVVFWFLSDQLS